MSPSIDISASQWNTSPIYGKVGSAVGLKSPSVSLPGVQIELEEEAGSVPKKSGG